MSDYDFGPAERLEERIEAAQGEDLRARWEFGRWMLTFVPDHKKNLPAGFVAGLAEATGASRAELSNRRQFAERFDADALSNAVRQSFSWHRISNTLLGDRGEERPARWELPAGLFDELHAEFSFNLDLCAFPGTARCAGALAPGESLRQRWRGSCWLSLPVGEVAEPWVAKAQRAAEDDWATRVVCLLPAKVDAEWWWEHCLTGEIRFLRDRLKSGRWEAPFPSALVIFEQARESRVVWWERPMLEAAQGAVA